MKKFLPLAFLLTSCFCMAQETPKVDVFNPPTKKDRYYYSSATDSLRVDISGKKKGDNSNGASDKIYNYTRTASTGLVFSAVGSGLMVAGFALSHQPLMMRILKGIP